MKILIANGTIVDGSGEPRFQGDIFVEDQRIHAIGQLSAHRQHADLVVDATDAFVTPGFIDSHTHTDLANFLPQGLRPKIQQGVTTEVIGQCGLGVAPMPRAHQAGWRKNLIIGNPPIPWNWEGMGDYLAALEQHGLESNVVPFVGHGVLRYATRQARSGPLTDHELHTLRAFLEEACDAGVFGVSLGLIYVPALFADQRELRVVVETIAQYQGLLAVHLRSESDELLEAIEEMLRLTQEYGARLHLSHLKTIGQRNWAKIDQVFDLIDTYHLSFDCYPYLAGSTTLWAILPPFLLEGGGIEDALRKLQDPAIRQHVAEILSGAEPLPKGMAWDNIAELVGWENIVITDITGQETHEAVGHSLAEIAAQRGTHPAEAAMDLLLEASGGVRMIDYYENEDTLTKILRHPAGMIGTDTLLGGKVHPRVFGTYPKILRTYVFTQQLLSLETAIAKMTGRPAEVFGLSDRGLLRPGFQADIVIFQKNFADRATFEHPDQTPEGLRDVFINGDMKIRDGEYLETTSGQMLRRHA